MDVLSQLEPQVLWRHFDRLRQVPRQSRHEKRARTFVSRWAQERKFAVRHDPYGNIVINVPATAGCESAPVVILQAHLDMVCEHSPEVQFDFLRDAIQVCIEGDWVRALGTTLGADNGIGVAAALAIADDATVTHGPLEILLTVEEELGLKGALQLDGSLVKGKLLVNLDSEDQAFYIGCAGATDIVGRLRFQPISTPAMGRIGRVMVSGLRGGHSGLSVLGNPVNAIKLLASILDTIRKNNLKFNIVELHGGSNRNAIPRNAFATLWVNDNDWAAVEEVVNLQEVILAEEFADSEAGLRIGWQALSDKEVDRVLSHADTSRIIDVLLAVPHGVLAMSRMIEGLVETSNNLAMVTTAEGEVVVSTLARSSSDYSLRTISRQMEAVFGLAGASAEIRNGYPGWQPDLDSALLALSSRVFEDLFGDRPQIKAIHAGLECGVIGQKVSGIDAISFGPLIEGAHTPEERVHVGSVAIFYRFLIALLAKLARHNIESHEP